MKAKFTKGPWKLYGDWGIQPDSASGDEKIFAQFSHDAECENTTEGFANAHLIACAPEMYKMIDELHRELNSAINEVNMHRALIINSQTETEPDYWDAQSCFEAQLLLKKARGE